MPMLLLFLTIQMILILFFLFIIRSPENDWSQVLFWDFTVMFALGLLSLRCWMLSVMKPVLLDFSEHYSFLNGLKILAAFHLMLDNFLHSPVPFVFCIILRTQLVWAFLFLRLFFIFPFHVLILLVIFLLIQKPFIKLNRYHHVIDIIFTVNTILLIHFNDEKQKQKLFEPFCESRVRTDLLLGDYRLIFFELIRFLWCGENFLVNVQFSCFPKYVLKGFATFQICKDVITKAFFHIFQSVMILSYSWLALEQHFLFKFVCWDFTKTPHSYILPIYPKIAFHIIFSKQFALSSQTSNFPIEKPIHIY